MTESLRDQILGRQDLPVEVIAVPEWGMDVRVRALTGTERDAYEASTLKAKPGKDGATELEPSFENMRANLVARCVVDEEGHRVFSDADVPAVGGKSGAVLSRLFEACQRMNGLRPQDFEESLGNSEGAPAAS